MLRCWQSKQLRNKLPSVACYSIFKHLHHKLCLQLLCGWKRQQMLCAAAALLNKVLQQTAPALMKDSMQENFDVWRLSARP